MREETQETHPSYVQVRFSRTQGGNFKLYGSELPRHNNTVTLTVRRSTRIHGSGKDWHHGEIKPILELRLSPSQFASLLTTMNVGSGVPGTLTYFNGQDIPRIPDEIETESSKIVNKFKEEVEQHVKESAKILEEIETILNDRRGKSLRKDDQQRILLKIQKWHRFLSDTAPFTVESLNKAAVKTSSRVKADVDAALAQVMDALGHQKLRELQAEAESRLIEG